jgi:GDP-4-dehydro-6-deoxy-D-mannose reductase
VKVLVTGAAGFVGRAVVARLIAEGHGVVGTRLPSEAPPDFLPEPARRQARWIPLDLRDGPSVRSAVEAVPDAVIHLAAVASGAEARRDPGLAWDINAGGTARLADALIQARQAGAGDPLLLLVSTAEAYGAAEAPVARTESDPARPCSPYAASKLGAEVAALAAARQGGLRVIITRSFPHTGPGQSDRYVVPAFTRRLKAARRIGARVVKTGNLEPVRDFLDVRDVAAAYVALLARGRPGETYNVASGTGHSLEDIFHRLAELIGVRAIPEVDAELTRAADIRHLVGDATRLRVATGWSPVIPFDQTLQDVVHAQAD